MQRTLPLVFVLLSTFPAAGQVSSVYIELFNEHATADYDGTTLSVNKVSTLDLVTVEEASGYVSGFTNMSLSLTTNFAGISNIAGFTWGRFEGGSVELLFDDGTDFFQLSGPIDVLLIKVDIAGGGYTSFSGEGWFEAMVADLPPNPTGIWPQMSPLLSRVAGLAFQVDDMELPADYDWTTPWSGVTQSSVWWFIPEVPEPTTFAFFCVGALVALRRENSRRSP